MGVLPAETVVRVVIVMLILPLMCGSFFAARLRRHEGRGFFLNAFVFGWIAAFVLFELVCTPFVVTLGRFSSFCRIYNICVFAASFVSVAAAAVVLYKGRTRAGRRGTVQKPETKRDEAARGEEKPAQYEGGTVRNEGRPSQDEGRLSQDEGRLSQDEERPSQDEGRFSQYEERLSQYEGRLSQYEERPSQDEGRLSQDEERPSQDRERLPQDEENPVPGGREKTAWWAWILWAAVIVSVLAQMVFFYFYNHMNGDDSYYIAQSVITDFMDTMYQRDAYTGTPMGLDVRHALSVLPVFVTWIGRVCGVHAATAAHAILGPVLFAVCYSVYSLLGKALFAKNRNMVPLFVLFVQLWYFWGNVSIFTPETFLYTRTWQGKAVFANIILPVAFYLLYRLLTEWKTIYMILLLLLSVAGIFTTTASVFLLSMLYGIAACYCLLTQRRLKKFLSVAVCAAPAFLYGLLYLWLLRTW